MALSGASRTTVPSASCTRRCSAVAVIWSASMRSMRLPPKTKARHAAAASAAKAAHRRRPTLAGSRGALGPAPADELAPFVPVGRLGLAQRLGGTGDLRPVAPMVGARRQPGLEAGAQFVVRRLLAERDQPVAGGRRSVAVRRNRCLAHASGSSLTSYTTAIRTIFRSFSSAASGNAPGHRAPGRGRGRRRCRGNRRCP